MTPEELTYLNEVKEELSKERFNLHFKLKAFSALYPKTDTNTFYRQCAYTHSYLYIVPAGFPKNLLIAKTTQVAVFYSNLSRTVLLYREGYSQELLTSPTHPKILFQVKKDLEDILTIEHKLELYKYLNYVLKSVATKNYNFNLKPKGTVIPPVDIQKAIQDFNLKFEQYDIQIKQLNAELKSHTHTKKSKI